MRKSSIHFKSVEFISFAISHAERTELSEPGYLLPQKHRLGNFVVNGSLSEAELKDVFQKRKAGLSRQAKTAGASPFWEGVMVLPEYHGQDYSEQQANSLKEWKAAFEESTGMRVLHMSIHLDEGYINEAGDPQYNPHAHIFVDRTDDKNKIISLGRGKLSKVQDLTAEKMDMQRGETLEDRGGRRGRRHIDSKYFRDFANELRNKLEQEQKIAKGAIDGIMKMWGEDEQRARRAEDALAQVKAELAQAEARAAHDANYRELRGWMIGDGRAKQADYSALKKIAEGPGGRDKIQRLVEVWESGGDALEAMRPVPLPVSAKPPAQPSMPEPQMPTPRGSFIQSALQSLRNKQSSTPPQAPGYDDDGPSP